MASFHRCTEDGRPKLSRKRCEIYYAVVRGSKGWERIIKATGFLDMAIQNGADALEVMEKEAEAWLKDLPIFQGMWEREESEREERAKPAERTERTCIYKACPQYHVAIPLHVRSCPSCGESTHRAPISSLKTTSKQRSSK